MSTIYASKRGHGTRPWQACGRTLNAVGPRASCTHKGAEHHTMGAKGPKCCGTLGKKGPKCRGTLGRPHAHAKHVDSGATHAKHVDTEAAHAKHMDTGAPLCNHRTGHCCKPCTRAARLQQGACLSGCCCCCCCSQPRGACLLQAGTDVVLGYSDKVASLPLSIIAHLPPRHQSVKNPVHACTLESTPTQKDVLTPCPLSLTNIHKVRSHPLSFVPPLPRSCHHPPSHRP